MESRTAATGAFDQLGLRANPFDTSSIRSADSPGIKLAIRAASLRLLAAIDAAASDSERKPILIEKADLPPYYHIAALSQTLAALGSGEPVAGVLGLYVPVDMMRIGRVRAVLHTVTEAVSGIHTEQLMGAWTRSVLESPDETLPEWVVLAGRETELAQVRSDLESDPGAVAIRLFGEPVQSRPGAEDLEMLVRVAGARVNRLETDPAEGEDIAIGVEVADDDPMADAFTTPMGDAERVVEEGTEFDQLLADYVIAHTAAHLSPVVARGLRAFVSQGTAAMNEELKVTKAPTKTLSALLAYAGAYYRTTVLFIDRFDLWPTVPTDLRLKIVNTLTSLRWELKENAELVIMLAPGMAPEVEEAFAAASMVRWDYSELNEVEQGSAVFDRPAFEKWLSSASVDGEMPQWAGALLDEVPAESRVGIVATALAELIQENKTAEKSAVGAAIKQAEELA